MVTRSADAPRVFLPSAFLPTPFYLITQQDGRGFSTVPSFPDGSEDKKPCQPILLPLTGC